MPSLQQSGIILTESFGTEVARDPSSSPIVLARQHNPARTSKVSYSFSFGHVLPQDDDASDRYFGSLALTMLSDSDRNGCCCVLLPEWPEYLP